jgi:tetratricopeptide (TPR) repeat protein
MVKAATAQRHARESELLANDVGKRIRGARIERGLSLAQLGGEDLSRSFLSLVELGRSRISLRALKIVADRLQLPISYFLDGSVASAEAVSELLLDRVESALRQQKPSEALRLLVDVEVPDLLQPRALWLQGSALIDAGRPHDAVDVLREAIPRAERRGEPRQQVEIRYTLARALFEAGSYDEALAHARRALGIAMWPPEDRVLMGKVTVGIGHILYIQGNYDDSLAHYARARQLFDTVDDMDNLAAVYTGLSRVYQHKGDLANAVRYSRLSVGIYEAKQNRRNAARELENMAGRYAEQGLFDKALECAKSAISKSRSSRARDVEALSRSTLASIHFQMGELEKAESEAKLAESLVIDKTDFACIDAWVVLGRIADRRADHGHADTMFRRALDVSRDTGRTAIYADTALAYSLVLRERGDVEGALKFALEAAQGKSARATV